MSTYWLTSSRMSVKAIVDDCQIVRDTATITKRFIGKPFKNLENWMKKQGGFKEIKIK